jgi:antitoxin FitA
MPSLQVRDLPEEIYQALKRAAQAEHRSLSQQAIVALARGLDLGVDHRKRRANLLRQWKQEPLGQWAHVDVTAWVRADRDSR